MVLRLKYKTLVGLAIITSIFIIGIASFAETIKYTYDNSDRLTKVEYSNGTVVEYTYDLAGNRLQEKINTTSAKPGQVPNVTKTSVKPNRLQRQHGFKAEK